MIYCAKFQFELYFFTTHLGGDFGRLGGVIKKLFNSVHRLRVYAKFGVCSSYGVRETLSGHARQTDRRTDMAKSILLVADQEYIYFIGSDMSPSTCYIHSAYTNMPFFLFLRESGLNKIQNINLLSKFSILIFIKTLKPRLFQDTFSV